MTTDLEHVLRNRLSALGSDIEAAPDLEDRIADKRAGHERRARRRAAVGSTVIAFAVAAIGFVAISATGDSHRVATTSPSATVPETGRPTIPEPSPGDFATGRFTRPVGFDNGGLTITPAAATAAPPITEAQARVLVGSDSKVDEPGWDGELAFGDASINSQVFPGVTNTPVWVALVPQPVFLCSSVSAAPTATTSAPLGPGDLVVIIANNGTTVINYRTRAQACGPSSTGPSASAATQLFSMPWQEISLSGGTLTFRWQEPACDPHVSPTGNPSAISVGGDANGQWSMEALLEVPYTVTYGQLVACGGPFTTSTTQIGPIPEGPGAPTVRSVSHAPTGPVGALQT